MNRRDLLLTSALASAATLLPRALSAQQGHPSAVRLGIENPIRLGMTSYTFRKLKRTELIAALKSLHLSTVNCKDALDHMPQFVDKTTDIDYTGIKAAVADYIAAGITVSAVGTVYFRKPEEFRKNFEYAKAAGVKVMVAGDPTPADLPAIEKLVKEFDIRFALHNHGPEDKLWPSPLTVLEAVKNMDPRMGCCIDVGHTMRTGTNVVDAIKKVGPRLFDVHMKDLAKADSKESQVAVGAGIMPVREIFQTLINIKYAGNVDLEYEIFPDNPMPGVIESISYMRGVLNGMGLPSSSAAV
jgi:sugar phosphate isomerase/epimerase